MTSRIYVNVVLDKSGSMAPLQEATISGLNEYLDSLRRDKAHEYYLSIIAFDTEYSMLCVASPLENFHGLTRASYVPDGMTALYDAIYHSVKEADRWLQSQMELYRKDYKVLCVVYTDGQENSSKKHGRQEIFDLVRQHEASGYWTFVYLGANQDSWGNSSVIGFHKGSTADWNSTPAGTRAAFANLSVATATYAASSATATPSFFEDTQVTTADSANTQGVQTSNATQQ